MEEVISSLNNDSIKYLKKLYKTRKRKQENKFILEGARIIEEATKAGVDFDQIFMTPQFKENNKFADIKIINYENTNMKCVERSILEDIADTVSPQGIIAIVNKPEYQFEKIKNRNKLLVLDQVQDPGNMGTLIRTAVASGMDGILALKGCVDIYNLKVIRATMGAIFNIPVLTRMDLDQFIKISNTYNYNIISSDSENGKLYNKIDYNEPFMIVIGNEGRGIRSEIISLSDKIVKIPIIGDIDSLNAAVAGGIILYKSVEDE